MGTENEKQIRELVFSQYNNDQELISALNNSKEQNNGIYVYVTEKALGISLPVAHVAGDHAEFEIDLNLLK